MKTETKWQAFEYEHKAKTADWFWMVWIIAIGIAITAYLFNNLLFGIFILISAFSLSLFASRKPSLLNFTLSETGLLINEKFIPFSSLQSFWIENNHLNSPKMNGQGKIIFQAHKKTIPYIIIPLSESLNTEHLKEFLLKHLEETEHQEPLTQKIFEKLGF